MSKITPYLILVLAASYAPGIVKATEDLNQIQRLTSQVNALMGEVAELKRAVESLKVSQPTVTMLMPDFAERFHVMHYAGEARDWAVASHELLGIRHLLEIMQQVDPAIGAMAIGFLDADLKQLDAAIEHENVESFNQALTKTEASCNRCHVAAGSPSMKITLNAGDSLSMRHSHDLGISKKPGEHMHTH